MNDEVLCVHARLRVLMPVLPDGLPCRTASCIAIHDVNDFHATTLCSNMAARHFTALHGIYMRLPRAVGGAMVITSLPVPAVGGTRCAAPLLDVGAAHPIFAPGGTWSQGRNVLYRAAQRLQAHKRKLYRFFTFADEDTTLRCHAPDGTEVSAGAACAPT
jgi:hypothetical protein